MQSVRLVLGGVGAAVAIAGIALDADWLFGLGMGFICGVLSREFPESWAPAFLAGFCFALSFFCFAVRRWG